LLRLGIRACTIEEIGQTGKMRIIS